MRHKSQKRTCVTPHYKIKTPAIVQNSKRQGLYEIPNIGEQWLAHQPDGQSGHVGGWLGVAAVMPGKHHGHESANGEGSYLLLDFPVLPGQKTPGHENVG